jgi:hypothetical protein
MNNAVAAPPVTSTRIRTEGDGRIVSASRVPATTSAAEILTLEGRHLATMPPASGIDDQDLVRVVHDVTPPLVEKKKTES